MTGFKSVFPCEFLSSSHLGAYYFVWLLENHMAINSITIFIFNFKDNFIVNVILSIYENRYGK